MLILVPSQPDYAVASSGTLSCCGLAGAGLLL